ncbi:hypothetical protein EDB84DRAFT_1481540 [Lactarius hengduanensis]|nr:hypothetical protein EDB84DRAFT_1481540 [Lactarius hengduanensis]
METVTVPARSSSPHLNPDKPPKLVLLDDPDADFILRSCDLQEFRVLKIYLIKNSPVLHELILESSSTNFPDSSTSPHVGALPYIRLSENGTILSSLLSFILPVLSVLPPTIDQIIELLSAAQKYEMIPTLAHIREAIALLDPPFILPETAFHIYSLAQRYGLGQEVVRAARMALTSPITIEVLEDKLDIMPGAHLHLLWKYYQRVRINLRSDLTAFRTNGAHSTLADLTCSAVSSSGIPSWLDDYIVSIGEDPSLFDLNELYMCLARHIVAASQDSVCASGTCGTVSAKTIRAFWKAFTAVVNDSMTKDEKVLVEKARSQSRTSSARDASPLPAGYIDPPNADIILRSSDLINFRTNKAILSMSSPFFNDMLSLPQPSNDEVVDGLPVVCLSEDAETLNSLLMTLYPIPFVVPNNYHKVLAVLAASQKYDMAGVQSSIRTEIENRGPIVLTGTEALRAYVVSSGAKLLPEMKTSALLTLHSPLTLEHLGDELPLFEGWALRDFVRYRKRCRDGLVLTLRSFLDSTVMPSRLWVVCTIAGPNSVYMSPQFPRWLRDFFSQHITKMEETFTNTLLNPSSIREEYLAALHAHISQWDCFNCAKAHALNGDTYCEELKSKLAQVLDQVRLILDPQTSSSLAELTSRNP